MITTEKPMSRLLREADMLLSALLSNTLIGIFVVQDSRFIFVNQRLADLFGYSSGELCAGMGPIDLIATSDQLETRQEIDRRLHGETRGSLFSFQGVRKDSSLIDVDVFGVATSFSGRPAVIGLLLDVSARCAAEQAATEQLHFIAQLVEAIPSPVFYKDEAGRYIGCNSAFERFIGLERGHLIGCTAHDISPKDLADVYVAADQALFDQPGTQIYEAAVAYADGTRHNAVFQKATFNKADGDLGGLVGIILDITERKRMEEAVWREANYDALTGLPNRRMFRDRLKEELKQARHIGHEVAVLFIDLDRFKEVNDTLGHDTGDQLLIEAAARLRAALRASDIVSRQGGDEFVVAITEVVDVAAVGLVAEKIIRSLARPFDLEGQVAYVSASVGIALYPNDSGESETLISYADQAMYAAKAHGRNCFCHFKPAMQTLALARLEIGNDLRRAVIERQFELHYQPIVDLTSGRIVKVEALLRWNHPTRGMVAPAEFIPICEDIGIIGDIGNWVLREAIATASRWEAARQGKGEAIQVSVNISPRQFISGNCGKWVEFLRQHGLPPRLLAVEITEGLLLDERPAVVETLLGFRDAGIQVSIDDFGTGYSAMSYLKKFDIDYLKIDRSFVRDLTSDPTDLAIAEAIIVMAHKLGILVIAEGVETEAQRRLLRQAGCDYAQGYLFAKPMPAADIERLIIG